MREGGPLRIWRRPFRFVIGLTVVAALSVPLLLAAIVATPSPECFEYCNLGQQFAGMLLLLVGVLWLAVVLVFAWDWVEEEPAFAAVSAVAASVCLVIVTLRAFTLVPYGRIPDPLVQLAWVLALGLQLPPVWRLAARPTRSIPLQIVVGLMGLLVAVTGIAAVLLGSNPGSSAGPSFVVLAWFGSVVGVLIVAIAAWRDGVAEPRLVVPLVLASLPVLLVPIGIAAPGDIGFVIFAALPLTAIAWLGAAFAWFRDTGAPPQADRGSGVTSAAPDQTRP
jgi:hypothetical protein